MMCSIEELGATGIRILDAPESGMTCSPGASRRRCSAGSWALRDVVFEYDTAPRTV